MKSRATVDSSAAESTYMEIYAPMVELVDTLVLEASAERCASSSLAWGTNHGEEASMVMQWTVNPPPMARLVRSQYSPPNYTLVDKQVKSLLQEGRVWRSESSPGYHQSY